MYSGDSSLLVRAFGFVGCFFKHNTSVRDVQGVWDEAEKGFYSSRLRIVMSPATDLAFSRATGFCGSGEDERVAAAE